MFTTRSKTGVCIAAGLTLLVAHGARAAASDPWITTKAKITLLTSEGVSGSRINVDTVNGEVTLHGKVASPAEKTKAEALVRQIDGVGGVRNLLQVVPEELQKRVTASDAEIKTHVEQTLARHPALTDVSVQSVNDGVVLLAGEVKTLSAHLEAIKITAQVPGVYRVASEIKSPNGLGDEEIYSERAPKPAAAKGVTTTARDMWITSAVKMRLLADDRAPGLAVNVDTDGGRVTLFGRVGSEAARMAAAEDAHKASGVTQVINDLQVVPTAKEAQVKARDEDVEQHIKAALSRRDDLRDADIDVDVRDGIARLTGTVPSETQRLTAAVVARTTAGVRAVRDELRIEAN
jgi:hyperosmotically inducible periplasmic protein